MNNYLQLLEESLKKKLDVLSRIEMCNKKQEEILKSSQVVMEEFDSSIDEKGILIDEINVLNDGFEQLYERVREQLIVNKEQYKSQIRVLQKLITEVTDKSTIIQAQELRNKKLVENYFAEERQALRHSRQGSKAALDYYKNMSRSNIVTPQVMDQKK